MASTELSRAKERFLEAVELSGAERAAWLARLAQEDPALEEAVRALLLAHDGELAAGLERRADALDALGTPAPARRAAGQRLGEHELLEEIGSGAHGVVWRARHLALGRVVALKVLRAGYLAGTKELERLRAEAAAVARLDHPHIVPVHEVGEHDGFAFFSMKWIEGGTLADRLGEPWPAQRAARLVAVVARAVHHAHQRGLLHRDLKPSNVLLDPDGGPHVADFGIAKRLDEGGAATTTRGLAGTPAYMAPEQSLGEELTVATDVWALGCILHELLAGHPAFAGDSVTEILRKIRHEEPPSLRALRPDVPRDLETIVLACLRKDPARRYASAMALADDLERWLAHEPIAARRATALDRLVLFCRRSPLAASLIGIAAGLVILLAIVATYASVELGARLRDSYLGQARATRLSGATGARSSALELLGRAAAIRPGEDLRDEAIACLALTDVHLERTWTHAPGPDNMLTPDGAFERLVISDAGGLRLLDMDGVERAVLWPRSDARFARWSAGGRWLLSRHESADDARIRVWEPANGVARLVLSDDLFHRAGDFSPDERGLAYATEAGELVVIDVPSGAERFRVDLGSRPRALRYAPDGEQLAVAREGEPNVLEIREAATGALLVSAELASLPYDVCWTGDGRGPAVACADYTIRVFDAGATTPRVVCQGHSAEVVELHACPGTTLVTSYSWDETMRLWDTATGRELRRASGRALGFTADGLRVGLTDARSWSVWRVEHGDLLAVHRTAHTGKSPMQLAFRPGGGLATGGPDGVFLWTGDPRTRPRLLHAHDTRALRFAAGGRVLYSSGQNGLFRTELEPELEPEREPQRVLEEPLWGLALSADERTLAAQARDVVLLLDPERPTEVRELHGIDGMEYLSMSANGARVAAGNWRGRGVRVWTRGEDEPRELLSDKVNVSTALSPDGELLATSTSERVELWRTSTGERLNVHERRRAFGNSPAPLAFSPDGTWLAFALSNEIVRLIDVRTFETRATLEPPQLEALFDLTFSADGRRLGAACSTNRVQIWDLGGIEERLAALGLGTGD